MLAGLAFTIDAIIFTYDVIYQLTEVQQRYEAWHTASTVECSSLGFTHDSSHWMDLPAGRICACAGVGMCGCGSVGCISVGCII